jgi:protein-S-isoprenylcysteine O-methyltransferase Ste14
LRRRLHTGGPFRFTRNPEVAGHVGAVGGLALAAGSWQALVLALTITTWFATRPLAEEPVMAARFGRRFTAYRDRVPRYLDLGRLWRALVGDAADSNSNSEPDTDDRPCRGGGC